MTTQSSRNERNATASMIWSMVVIVCMLVVYVICFTFTSAYHPDHWKNRRQWWPMGDPAVMGPACCGFLGLTLGLAIGGLFVETFKISSSNIGDTVGTTFVIMVVGGALGGWNLGRRHWMKHLPYFEALPWAKPMDFFALEDPSEYREDYHRLYAYWCKGIHAKLTNEPDKLAFAAMEDYWKAKRKWALDLMETPQGKIFYARVTKILQKNIRKIKAGPVVIDEAFRALPDKVTATDLQDVKPWDGEKPPHQFLKKPDRHMVTVAAVSLEPTKKPKR